MSPISRYQQCRAFLGTRRVSLVARRFLTSDVTFFPRKSQRDPFGKSNLSQRLSLFIFLWHQRKKRANKSAQPETPPTHPCIGDLQEIFLYLFNQTITIIGLVYDSFPGCSVKNPSV